MLLTPWGRYTSNFLLLDTNETNDFFASQNYSVFKEGGGGLGGPGGPGGQGGPGSPGGPCGQGGSYGLNYQIIEES